MKEKIDFQNVVAETLLIPLAMRARESRRRKKALLHDPLAERLVASIDYDYSKFGRAPMSALGCVIRSSLYDGKVQEFIRSRRNPVVVNVGCGLDTRYQRITDRRGALFYEMDLPEVIAVREKLIPPPEGDEYLVEEWVPQLKLVRQWLYMDFARGRWGVLGVLFRLFPKFTRKFSSLCMYKILPH